MKAQATRQRGFTLIELIVVIVILGILSAIALPKFADFGGNARIASLKAVQGSLTTVSTLAKGKYLVASAPPATVVLEGVTVTYSTAFASGYPKADANLPLAAGVIVGATGDYTFVAPSAVATANSPSTSATEIALIPASVAGTIKGLNCYVRYTEPTSATSAPTIAVTSGSC